MHNFNLYLREIKLYGGLRFVNAVISLCQLKLTWDKDDHLARHDPPTQSHDGQFGCGKMSDGPVAADSEPSFFFISICRLYQARSSNSADCKTLPARGSTLFIFFLSDYSSVPNPFWMCLPSISYRSACSILFSSTSSCCCLNPGKDLVYPMQTQPSAKTNNRLWPPRGSFVFSCSNVWGLNRRRGRSPPILDFTLPQEKPTTHHELSPKSFCF